MVACITASIELATKQDPNLRFISEQEILTRSPNKTLEIPCSISYTNQRTGKRQSLEKLLIPDAIFGIEYGGTSTPRRTFEPGWTGLMPREVSLTWSS